MKSKETLQILIAAAEAAPLAKTGGLADVAGTLPSALRRLGVDARVIMPYHRIIKNKYAAQVEHMCSFSVQLGWRSQYVGLSKLTLGGTTFYLIDNEYYFGDAIYRGGMAEGEQYAFFTRAVLEAVPLLDFAPRLIHANDWHTAMLPMLIKTQYQGRPQGGLKTLLTIHNIAYQGKFGFEFVRDLLNVESWYMTSEFMESYGAASFLKAGCVFADRLNTVSPTYAQEIRSAYYGEGLEGILNARSAELCGVLNGINTKAYDPATDKLLPARYTANDISGKAECKRALLGELGLNASLDTPLVAMVSRLVAQKGLDLIERVLPEMMAEQVTLVFLGSGEKRYEQFLRESEQRWRGRLCAYIAYHEDLAHRIYAGADMFLMPSRFEPCGLAQMIAMRYGTVPLVRETGGLKDTVMPYNKYEHSGTGFGFANYNAHEMLDAFRSALAVYRQPQEFAALRRSAMAVDFSFNKSARQYRDIYVSLLT